MKETKERDEKLLYKEMIIEMVKKCDDMHWLKVIYAYINGLLK